MPAGKEAQPVDRVPGSEGLQGAALPPRKGLQRRVSRAAACFLQQCEEADARVLMLRGCGRGH